VRIGVAVLSAAKAGEHRKNCRPDPAISGMQDLFENAEFGRLRPNSAFSGGN